MNPSLRSLHNRWRFVLNCNIFAEIISALHEIFTVPVLYILGDGGDRTDYKSNIGEPTTHTLRQQYHVGRTSLVSQCNKPCPIFYGLAYGLLPLPSLL